MKIYNNDQILKSLFPEKQTNPQPPSDKEFGTLLNESIENTKKEVTGTHRPTFISPLNGIQMTELPRFDKQIGIERIENLIDLLDQYRRKLADPGITLKNIDPIIREINKEKENLTPTLDSLPEGEELKNILNQTLVTASLEVGKFYRGDYVAP